MDSPPSGSPSSSGLVFGSLSRKFVLHSAQSVVSSIVFYVYIRQDVRHAASSLGHFYRVLLGEDLSDSLGKRSKTITTPAGLRRSLEILRDSYYELPRRSLTHYVVLDPLLELQVVWRNRSRTRLWIDHADAMETHLARLEGGVGFADLDEIIARIRILDHLNGRARAHWPSCYTWDLQPTYEEMGSGELHYSLRWSVRDCHAEEILQHTLSTSGGVATRSRDGDAAKSASAEKPHPNLVARVAAVRSGSALERFGPPDWMLTLLGIMIGLALASLALSVRTFVKRIRMWRGTYHKKTRRQISRSRRHPPQASPDVSALRRHSAATSHPQASTLLDKSHMTGAVGDMSNDSVDQVFSRQDSWSRQTTSHLETTKNFSAEKVVRLILMFMAGLIQVFAVLHCAFPWDGASVRKRLNLLGWASALSYFNLVPYFSFFDRWYVMYMTLRRGIPRCLRFGAGVAPLFCGYVVLGVAMWGISDQDGFKSLSHTSATLFALLNGDIIRDTFLNLGDVHWLLAQIYLYSFMCFFMYVVLNVLLAIMEEAFAFTAAGRHLQIAQANMTANAPSAGMGRLVPCRNNEETASSVGSAHASPTLKPACHQGNDQGTNAAPPLDLLSPALPRHEVQLRKPAVPFAIVESPRDDDMVGRPGADSAEARSSTSSEGARNKLERLQSLRSRIASLERECADICDDLLKSSVCPHVGAAASS